MEKTLKTEILFELIPIGNAQKASAIDPKTHIEVSIITPPHASRAYVEKVLLRKLKKRMSQK